MLKLNQKLIDLGLIGFLVVIGMGIVGLAFATSEFVWR